MSADRASAVAVLGLMLAVASLYGTRVMLRGVTRSERVKSAGASPLLGRSSMEGLYWALDPLASLFVRLRISANAITMGSLAAGLGAGALLAFGHFGIAAAATAIASLADALDGIVARKTGTTSAAGELFDASVDRYVELFFLGGVAIHFRGDAWALALVLGAVVGSFMVSYSSAKAEALHVAAPRGAMRRAERAVVLFAGAALTPFANAWSADRIAWLSPMLGAVAIVAVIANVSAIRRLRAIARASAAREAEPEAEPVRSEPISDPPLSPQVEAARPLVH